MTLEHLEATFYAEGLKNYTHQDFLDAGFPDPFYSNLQQVASDEKSHVDFLTKALSGMCDNSIGVTSSSNIGFIAAGANPVNACTYAFPAVDAKTFVTTANILEGVGVSAYTGAAAKIANDKYLTAAASILGVEGRHSSYFRALLGEVPFQPFEVPLNFDEVYTVASAFIASCPKSNGKLPVKAFPSLTATSSGETVMCGSMVTLKAGEGYMEMDNVYAAFITVNGPVWADLKPKGNGEFTVTVPEDIMGQSYVVLTKGNKHVTDENICAGPAILQVGPMVGTPSCSNNGGMSMSSGHMSSSGMMPTGGMMHSGAMSTGAMMPTGGMMHSGAMSTDAMMSTGGMMHSGAMPTGRTMPTGGMMHSGGMSNGPMMPTGGMMPSGAMSTGSMMPTSSMMPSGSSSSSMPMYTGGAGKTLGNVAGAISASIVAAVLSL